MIERFLIDPTKGGHDQVGLFLAAADPDAQQFNMRLRQQGFSTRPLMRSVRPDHTHFTYVGLTGTQASKQRVQQLLRPVCQRELEQPVPEAALPTTYEEWRASFNAFVQAYRAQRLEWTVASMAAPFDKERAYHLIESGQFAAAEKYLNDFATDSPPTLLPAYQVYLFHAWNRPEALVATYRRYAQRLAESDVPVRVVEWIAAACLQLTPPDYELALAVADSFLPEFQRQGVAEQLLAIRAQARAGQGQLPFTLPELQAYVAQTPTDLITNQLEDLLQIITGLPATMTDLEPLLDTFQARVPAAVSWRVVIARSVIAQRAGALAEARHYLTQVTDGAPADISPTELAEFCLNAAGLDLQLGDPTGVLAQLSLISQVDLGSEGERTYWSLSGQAQLAIGDRNAALQSLRRAYELGATSPAVIHPLARLAYMNDEQQLASRLYSQLLSAGFEPSPEDQRIQGLLSWLISEPREAVVLLEQGLDDPTLDPRTVDPSFYSAYIDCLRATEATVERLIDALQRWGDVLVAQRDAGGIRAFIQLTLASGLATAEQYLVLEAVEPLAIDDPELRATLVDAYEKIFSLELASALRDGAVLPEYILSLRRGLFTLDREHFEYAQDLLNSELARYRQGDLATPDYTPLPPDPTLDLSGRWVALIGGYSAVRRRVRETLINDFGLERFTDVAPSWEEHVSEHRVAEAVRDADLIVVMHRVTKHDGTNALNAVVTGTPLENRVRYAPGKGLSSVVRTVLSYFASA